MKFKVGIGLGLVLSVVAIMVIPRYRNVAAESKVERKNPVSHEETQEHHEPGLVRFNAGAAQLSYIHSTVVKRTPIPIAEPFNGRIAYDENVTARVSSPILGRVLTIPAEIGQRLKKGATLATIDSPDLANAQADWKKAQSDENRKRLAFQRSKELMDHDVIPRKDYESAQADYQQAVAETQRAVQHLHNLHASGKEEGVFSLKAPIDGVVADRQINPGQEVRPDATTPLFVLTDTHHLWVLVDVAERDMAKIKLNQVVSIQTDAYPQEHFLAHVDRIAWTLDPATRRLQVRCALNNPGDKLRPEMFARVSFLADNGQLGVRLPNTGLVIEGVYHYVFVEKTPGVFEKRQVNVVSKGSETSFIDQGLSDGEHVVIEGALLLNSELSSETGH
jgi:membrane fusion protein, heavy metal efflux system